MQTSLVAVDCRSKVTMERFVIMTLSVPESLVGTKRENYRITVMEVITCLTYKDAATLVLFLKGFWEQQQVCLTL